MDDVHTCTDYCEWSVGTKLHTCVDFFFCLCWFVSILVNGFLYFSLRNAAIVGMRSSYQSRHPICLFCCATPRLPVRPPTSSSDHPTLPPSVSQTRQSERADSVLPSQVPINHGSSSNVHTHTFQLNYFKRGLKVAGLCARIGASIHSPLTSDTSVPCRFFKLFRFFF